MKAPWNRDWLQVTPLQFERMVVEYLRSMDGGVEELKIEHQAPVSGPDGEFVMDAVAAFRAFGAQFTVLVECKHHRNPIKRELVQVLADKVRSVRAHKGMLFSTAPFQRGAIEYAASQGIALVHCTEGGPIYETRSREGLTGPKGPYEAYFVSLTPEGGKIQRRVRGIRSSSTW